MCFEMVKLSRSSKVNAISIFHKFIKTMLISSLSKWKLEKSKFLQTISYNHFQHKKKITEYLCSSSMEHFSKLSDTLSTEEWDKFLILNTWQTWFCFLANYWGKDHYYEYSYVLVYIRNNNIFQFPFIFIQMKQVAPFPQSNIPFLAKLIFIPIVHDWINWLNRIKIYVH